MVVDSTLTPSLPSTGKDDADLPAGQVVGEYEVERKLGQGGFGAVFKAVHPLIGKQAAIKVLSQRFSVDPQMVSRFVAEARAVNQIRHPNIIDIFSFGTLPDGRCYYVMEYLDGEALDRRLARRGAMSLTEAVPILRGIGRALDAAHAKGIAHRDLKAENVFLAAHPDGVFPKLLDFGIAKLMAPEDGLTHKTRTGAPMGTPHYMSPEQCHGRNVDHRTDLYAFGVLAYLMLTGVYPLDGEDYMAILMRQVHDEPPPPSAHRPELPVGVNSVIAWLMRKDPAARPETLMAAVRMLEQVASGEIEITVPPAGRMDSLSTLPVQSEPTPGELSSIPPNVTPSPKVSPSAKLTPEPPDVTPSGSRTPEGPAVPAEAGAFAAAETPGELPAVAPRRSQLPEDRRPRPYVLLAGGALLAGAAIVAVIALRSGGGDSTPAAPAQEPHGDSLRSPAVAASSPDAALMAAADAAPRAPDPAGPVQPAEVFVTIEGTPPNTEVRRGGVLLGIAPGRVQIPRGGSEVLLVLSADGHVPATLAVVPSEDLSRTVKLKPKATAVRPPATGGNPRGSPPRGGSAAKPPGPGSGGTVEPTNDLEDFPRKPAPPPPN